MDSISECSLFAENNKGNLLYHYTSLNSAISILSTKALLFSELSRMNDMDESWRPIRCRNLADGAIEQCEMAAMEYVQISLTCDDNPNILNQRRGFDIAPMWGYYAEGGNGICFVFNKKRIKGKISAISGCKDNYVGYSEEYDSTLDFETDNPKEGIKSHIKEVFFCKSDQWEYEQEYRIIKKKSDGVNYLDIAGCIEAIIIAKMGTTMGEPLDDSSGYWKLKRVCGDIPLFRYGPDGTEVIRVLFGVSDGSEVWTFPKRPDLANDNIKIVF